MSTKPAALRAEPHSTLGTTILRDVGAIIERWAERATEEQPSAKRAHHDALLDHLPTLVWEIGRALSDASGRDTPRHTRPANIHGDQRWEIGWSVEEVVRDYQLLRVVLLEHLNTAIGRPLSIREVMALGVFIDDAVAASVAAYTSCQAADSTPVAEHPTAPRDGLLDVLGVVGHELRNPMAPIGNALQILKVNAADPGTVERARTLMERQFRVMTRLVDDLLDLPRLDRGKVRLQPGRVDLASLIRNLAADRSSAFDEAGVTLTQVVPSVPLPTVGDAARLTQVFGNLLANALKFTDRGGEVRVTLGADRLGGMAVCSVRDSGIGIEPSVLPKVFDAFVQAERAVDRSRGGLGLGLALVKGFVELHGGTVRAASGGLGRGAEFTVELPLIALPTAATETEPPETSGANGKRVLVVEDNRDSAESLKMYLELLGHTVTVVHSGPDGVAAAQTVAFDVVVCDIGLPGMSGHAVCAALRKLPGSVHTRLIALSGHAPDAVGQSEGAGFDAYLLKPVEPVHLAELILGTSAETKASL